jgi:hypothetical protein
VNERAGVEMPQGIGFSRLNFSTYPKQLSKIELGTLVNAQRQANCSSS